jgi:hypothetical protein
VIKCVVSFSGYAVSQREVWVEVDCLFQKRDCVTHRCSHIFFEFCVLNKLLASEIKSIGLEVLCRPLFDSLFFFWRKSRG